MIDRRTFISALAIGFLATPLAGKAQPAAKLYRVGFLSSTNSVELFRIAMGELGYVEGKNLVMEVRIAAQLEQLPALAAELVSAHVDVILAVSPPAIQAAKDATATIPIIMAFTSIDPVQSGFVASLSRPGGNITGVAIIADEIVSKRLGLLKELLPRSSRIAVLAQANHAASSGQVKAAQKAAKSLGIEIQVLEVRDSKEYQRAFAAISPPTSSLLVLANPTFATDARLLADLAVKHKLPMLCEWPAMAKAGCIMAYGPDITALARSVATYVDRIARGARPASLPVEQPTVFDLALNLQTADTIDVRIPKSLRLQANVVFP